MPQCQGRTWQFTAQVKLLVSNTSTSAACDTLFQYGDNRCPKVCVRIIAGNLSKLIDKTFPGEYSGPWSPNGFNRVRGTFTVPASGFTTLKSAQFAIIDGRTGIDFVIDNVSLSAV